MTFASLVSTFVRLIQSAVGVLIVLALLLFLYGLVRYMMGIGDEEKQKESREYIVYGVIGLFVMVSMWGLVSVLTSTFIPSAGFGIPILNI